MKAQSDTKPAIFVNSNGKIQFNFNITRSTITDDVTKKSRTVWNYDYVEVNDTNRNTLIKAMMHDKYSKDDEIALINNNLKGDIVSKDNYMNYQKYREEVKNIVDTIAK